MADIQNTAQDNNSTGGQDHDKNPMSPTISAVPYQTQFTTFRSFSGIPDREDGKSAFHRMHEDPLQGYPLFAHFLSQRGYGIFRQFSHLTMRHLLYLQAGILEMEEELDKLERKIAKAEERREKLVPFSLYFLDKCGEAEGTLGFKLHQLWIALGEKLQVYHEALLQHHQLSKLPMPTHTEVEDVWNFLSDNRVHRDHGNPDDMFMEFPENSVWKSGVKERAVLDPEKDTISPTSSKSQKKRQQPARPIEEDLVSINASTDPPIQFAEHLRHRLIYYYCLLFYRDRPTNMYGSYTAKGKVFEGVINTMVLILSCVIPTVSIIALHFIDTQVWRLGFITLWAAGFSLCLSYFTGATHIQIFSASLGMAAIQVVFISPGVNISGD